MARRNRIVYYVTSHGFGHLNRAAAVVESMPPGVSILVKTHRDLFPRWRESVRRHCELLDGVFDCGAVHPPGESSLVDATATLSKYNQVHAAALERLDGEIAFLRRNSIAAVVSDIAPLPLRAAKEVYKLCRTMDYWQAEDYMAAKGIALRATDPEKGREEGTKQFLDEKTYRPGLGAYQRKKG
jgi:hypothetical protein